MALGFMPARRSGIHFELATLAVRRLRKANFRLKGRTEKLFEHTMVASLEGSRKLKNNLITQVGDEEVEKISQASLFGFKHRPDTTIGKDGTAIELKVITSSTSVRVLLGQALAYRMDYRFVILVLVDQTPDRQVVRLCADKKSREYALLNGLAEEFNIYTVVAPGDPKNLSFIPPAKRKPRVASALDEPPDAERQERSPGHSSEGG